jgi:hypothetical protein
LGLRESTLEKGGQAIDVVSEMVIGLHARPTG